MPIYEFVCPNCGEKIEIISSPSEKVICKCGCEMKKLISAPAFRIYTKV
jgi:putative FmdB family regulatory protein